MTATSSKIGILALTLICPLLAFAAAARGQGDEGQRNRAPKTWAIVVGVSKYARLPGGQQLQFAERDAASFADSIKKTAGADVRLMVGAEATSAAIKSALGNWLARGAAPGDTVYIFFSGHGIYEKEFGESYLLAYDSDAREPYSTALSITDLQHALSTRVRAGRVLILADAVRRDFFDPETDGAASASSFNQAIARMASSRQGLSAIIASGPGEFSREGQRWEGHGVFTRHLMDALAGRADFDGDGSITAEEVFSYLSARVAQDTSNKQNPWRSPTELGQLIMSRTELRAASTSRAPVASVPAAQQASPSATEPGRVSTSEKQAPQNKGAQVPASGQPKTAPALAGAAPATTVKPEPVPAIKSEKVEPKPHVSPDSRAVAANRTVAAAEPSATKSVEPPAKSAGPPVKSVPARTLPVPPQTQTVGREQTAAPQVAGQGKEIAVAALPPPPRPLAPPPAIAPVTVEPTRASTEAANVSMPVSGAGAAPSPLLLQFEAAISQGNLVEPKTTNAWEIFQRLSSEQGAAADLPRLKPMLAEALTRYGKAIVGGDVRADNIADKVDDFRRAGQMFTRARTLVTDNAEIAALEKLSAAQALIALQFYDEAERALAQVQNAKLAAVENALGLIYAGKLDQWRAERAFRRAIELDSKWAAPHYNLAMLFRSRQDEAAVEELERAASIDVANPVMQAALGDEYFTRQQWQRAADAFRKAIALKPSDDGLHTKLGHALYSQGLKQEADREYQRARELRAKQ